ncbi:hypothetical protein LLH23_07210 [bacterium]|nr:hypothetical protein [bacterium]
MAQKVMKVIAVKTQAPDQPGTGAKMAAALRDRGIALKAMWGWSAGGGMSTMVCIPEKVEELRKLAAEAGLTIEEVPMVWLEGADETGALVGFLEQTSAAGINVGKVMAIGAGGSFGAAFGFADEATVDRVIALMGG